MIPAPPWLAEMLRPKVVEASRSIHAEYAGRDGHAYALAAVRGELNRLSAAVPGERNDMAYKVACRLIELSIADWARLDYQEVQLAYLNACEMANAVTVGASADQQFLDGEAWSVWFSAERKAKTPAVLPDPEHLGTRVDWVAPSDFDQAGQGSANPFTSPGQPGISIDVAGQLINGPVEQGEVLDPFEIEVRKQVGWLLVRQEADRRFKVRTAVRTDFDQIALDDAGMAKLPDAIPLVADWLDQDCLARVNGPSGHGKSFVVLDLGACVSTGTTWHGQAVTRTKVCYVVAEGARGMAKRAQAWCQRHELDSTGITFVPRPVQITGPEWGAFASWCVQEQFGLIIFDTQARNTIESDENDATEMGAIVAGLDDVRVATGACTMLVHHRGLRGDHGRGSSAMRGALDIELDVSRQGTTITLKSTKQKDRADPEPIRFTMNPLGASVVLVGERDASGPFISPMAAPVSLRERCAVAIAYALIDASGSGLTRTEAQAHARVALGLGADESTRRTVRRAWADLIGLGRIAKASGREAHFFIDLEGATILQANPDKAVQGGPEVYEG